MPDPSLGILSQGDAIVQVKTTVNEHVRGGKHLAISAACLYARAVPQGREDQWTRVSALTISAARSAALMNALRALPAFASLRWEARQAQSALRHIASSDDLGHLLDSRSSARSVTETALCQRSDPSNLIAMFLILTGEETNILNFPLS